MSSNVVSEPTQLPDLLKDMVRLAVMLHVSPDYAEPAVSFQPQSVAIERLKSIVVFRIYTLYGKLWEHWKATPAFEAVPSQETIDQMVVSLITWAEKNRLLEKRSDRFFTLPLTGRMEELHASMSLLEGDKWHENVPSPQFVTPRNFRRCFAE